MFNFPPFFVCFVAVLRTEPGPGTRWESALSLSYISGPTKCSAFILILHIIGKYVIKCIGIFLTIIGDLSLSHTVLLNSALSVQRPFFGHINSSVLRENNLLRPLRGARACDQVILLCLTVW